jgi:hypothetical protein
MSYIAYLTNKGKCHIVDAIVVVYSQSEANDEDNMVDET